MQTKFAIAMLLGGSLVSANGFSQGIPPRSAYCNEYPTIYSPNGGIANKASQSVAWGLIVDREFGGCRCADEDE